MSAPSEGALPSLTVVIMLYNERATVEAVVESAVAQLKELPVASPEVVVVDDGSTDGSEDVARDLAAKHPMVRVIRHPENEGLGGVYRTGFREARSTFVTFLPADGQFPARNIARFWPLAPAHDLMTGYLDGTRTPAERLLSAIERLLVRLWLGPMPRFQGLFMIRRERLARLGLRSEGRGWQIVTEMLLRATRDGARTTSIPTEFLPRAHGVSKVRNSSTIFRNVQQLIALRKVMS